MFQFFSTSPIQIEGMGSARMEETSPHTFARQARKAKLQDTRETERVIMGRRMKYFFKVVNKLTPVLLDINLRPKLVCLQKRKFMDLGLCGFSLCWERPSTPDLSTLFTSL